MLEGSTAQPTRQSAFINILTFFGFIFAAVCAKRSADPFSGLERAIHLPQSEWHEQRADNSPIYSINTATPFNLRLQIIQNPAKAPSSGSPRALGHDPPSSSKIYTLCMIQSCGSRQETMKKRRKSPKIAAWVYRGHPLSPIAPPPKAPAENRKPQCQV